jgi:hypothetical protein
MTSENTPLKHSFILFREVSLPAGNSFSVFQGVLLMLLGSLILLRVAGIFPPFNTDSQLGLLLLLTSLQMLALGQFMGSKVTRSWLLITIGMVFAGLGIFSCIVPGVLTVAIGLLLGIQNLITGVVLLTARIIAPTLYGIRKPPAEKVNLPPIIKKLYFNLTITGITIILFGINILAPTLLPSLLGSVIYAIVLPVLVIIMGLLALGRVYFSQKLGERPPAAISLKK